MISIQAIPDRQLLAVSKATARVAITVAIKPRVAAMIELIDLIHQHRKILNDATTVSIDAKKEETTTYYRISWV